MSENIYKMESNELTQNGAYISFKLSSSGKKKNGLRIVRSGILSCSYYLVSEEPVESDIKCSAELVSLIETKIDFIIPKGKSKSENKMTSVGIKLARITSNLNVQEDEKHSYFFGTTLDDMALSELWSKNFLYDYKNGICDSDMTVDCADYKDFSGKEVVNFTNNGEIIQTDSIVCDEGSGNYFRVMGRTFTKEGAPFNKLQIKSIYKE